MNPDRKQKAKEAKEKRQRLNREFPWCQLMRNGKERMDQARGTKYRLDMGML